MSYTTYEKKGKEIVPKNMQKKSIRQERWKKFKTGTATKLLGNRCFFMFTFFE